MRIQLPPLTVDLEARTVRGPGVARELTVTEARLLGWLSAHAGETAARDHILGEVWGYAPRVVSRTLDTTLSRLRAKIEVDPSRPRYLRSVAGGGLRLEVSSAVGATAAGSDGVESGPPDTVGRAAELAAVGRLLERARLVTLAGPGGVGKTHLARCLAAGVAPTGGTERRAAVFCALDTATGHADLVQGVGRALSPDWDPRVSDPAALIALLVADTPPLLVLDNLEQVVVPAADLVRRILQECPEVRLLVTSREPVSIVGEVVVPLAPLSAEAAVRLFTMRVGPAVDPSWRDRPALDALLAQVDHLPLAIELIAGWTDTLPLPDLAARLGAGLDLLVSDRRDVPGRHRSLTRVIADSVALLEEEDAAALRGLAVYSGEFDAADAEAVVARPALLHVRSLARRSLLRGVHGHPGRFRLFEAVRLYLRSQGTPSAAWGRLARHLSRLGEDAALVGPAAARVERVADLRAVLVPGLAAGEIDAVVGCALALAAVPGVDVEDTLPRLQEVAERTTGLPRRRLSLAAARLLWAAGRLGEASARVAPLVTSPTGDAGTDVRTLLLAAAVERESGRSDAAVWHLTDALGIVEAGSALHGTILADLGTVYARQGRNVDAERCLREGLALLRDSPDTNARASAMSNLAALLRETGRGSGELLLGALALHRAAGQRRSEGIVLGAMGIERLDAGDAVEARRCFDEAIDLLGRAGARHAAAVFTANRAFVDRFEGDLPRARAAYEDALGVLRDIGDVTYQALVLGNLGEIAVEQGRVEEGRAILGQAVALAAGGRFSKLEGVFLGEIGLLDVRAGAVAEGGAALARGEEILREGGFRDELCRLRLRRALAALAVGETDAAWTWLEQARPLRRGVPWVERLWVEVEGALRQK